MSHSAEFESQRLDRLESETRRRKWDSVFVSRPREAQTASAAAPRSGAAIHRGDAGLETTPSEAAVILGLLSDRLDRLERLTSRLEAEYRRLSRRDRYRLRRVLAVALAASIMTAILAPIVGHYILRLAPLASPFIP